MNQPQISPRTRIWQLSLGLANTAVLHTLVKTGVIEQMRQQPQTLQALAQAGGLNADVLYRILRYATVIGVVDYNEGQFSLTETGRLLLKDVPGSIYGGILLFGSEAEQLSWLNLGYSLTTGDQAFEHVLGVPIFEYLDKHPDFAATFNDWMTDSAALTTRAVTEAYDFTPYRSVCDIGGGQGMLLKSILLANPHLHGILFDRESVVRDHLLTDMNGRVEIQAGNFFERVPSADLLMMKRVLHDWSDEKCQVILGRCRQAMQPAARLLIVDMVIDPRTDFVGTFYDLHMQVLAGGRERTEDEFSAMLQSAGMKLNRIIPTQSTVKIVEATL